MRNKTFLKEIVEVMNLGSKRFILEALAVFNSLKNVIQMETQNPFINFLEILDDKNDKRYYFAHALNNLEKHIIYYLDEWNKKESELPKAAYQSKWKRNRELKGIPRKGKRLIKKYEKGLISPKDFRKEFQTVEKELLKRQDHEKVRIEKQKLSVEMQLSELSSWTSKPLFRRKNRPDKNNKRSSRNEKYAIKPKEEPTK